MPISFHVEKFRFLQHLLFFRLLCTPKVCVSKYLYFSTKNETVDRIWTPCAARKLDRRKSLHTSVTQPNFTLHWSLLETKNSVSWESEFCIKMLSTYFHRCRKRKQKKSTRKKWLQIVNSLPEKLKLHQCWSQFFKSFRHLFKPLCPTMWWGKRLKVL